VEGDAGRKIYSVYRNGVSYTWEAGMMKTNGVTELRRRIKLY
jgi:hypothetical protein